MKRCPECRKDYLDDSLVYCLDDGAPLVQGSLREEPATAILSADAISGEGLTRALKAGQTATEKARGTGRLSTLFSREHLPWIAAGVFALIAGLTLGFSYFTGERSARGEKAVRLALEIPQALSFNDLYPDFAVISPDGQKVAFSATSNGKSMLYVRDLDSAEAKLLPGSENPLDPFWSPDSKSVAYGSNGKLKRSDLGGGNAQTLCDAARIVGGTWSKDGIIVFGPDYNTLLAQVSAKGGEPQTVNLQSDDIANERHANPVFMPDGRNFLFRRAIGNQTGINIKPIGVWLGSLDSPEIKQVLPDDTNVVYTPEGWLVYVRNDSLVAQPFDTGSLTVSGEPTALITGQKNALGNNRRFSVSDNGILIWQGSWERDYQLTWFDREGKQTGLVGPPAKVNSGQDPHISPDGKRLLIKRNPPNTLWVIDLEKGTDFRITSDFGQIPVWSPDGTKIAYSRSGSVAIKSSNGLGEAENILSGTVFPFSWSPDGRFIIFTKRGVKTRLDIYTLSMDSERKETLLLNSPYDENSVQISPDGKWLAYAADDTGNYEIYVQSFSPEGKLGSDRKRISSAGANLPVWRRDGNELFFIDADGQLMAANVKTGGPEFAFDTPTALFKTRMLSRFGSTHEFDVSLDGQRFVIGTLVGEPTAPPPTVILNWTAALKK